VKTKKRVERKGKGALLFFLASMVARVGGRERERQRVKGEGGEESVRVRR
jgi:hypothetical protein